MLSTLILQELSHDHLRGYISDYIAISADVSPWTEDHFLKDLPEKWDLSFAFWEDSPIAYCIMSRRNGKAHINQFMVASYARNDGIGAMMLVEAVKRGAETLKVDPANEGAIRFYRRHGWEDAGEENGYLVMVKR